MYSASMYSSDPSKSNLPTYQPAKYRNRATAYALWLLGLCGVHGAHRLYLGKRVSGGVWFFTVGCFFVGQFVDLFLIPGMVEDFNLRQEALQARQGFPPQPVAAYPPREPLKGQALMRQLIKLAARRQGLLSVTGAIAEIDEADFDDIEEAFKELERRGYAYCENDLVTGAIQYRFLELESEVPRRDR